MHLYPLQINGGSANCLAHLDAVTSTVLTVGGRKVEKVWTMLGEQRIGREVSTEATGGDDNLWRFFLEIFFT